VHCTSLYVYLLLFQSLLEHYWPITDNDVASVVVLHVADEGCRSRESQRVRRSVRRSAEPLSSVALLLQGQSQRSYNTVLIIATVPCV